MVADGERKEGNGLVQGVSRRERERRRSIGGLGRLYLAGPWITMVQCAGEAVAVAAGHRGSCGHVRGVSGGGLRPGEGREGAGKCQGIARVRLPIGALGWPVRVREEAGGGRRRRGTMPWRVEDAEEHRRAHWGGPRWPEVLGRGRLQCRSAL